MIASNLFGKIEITKRIEQSSEQIQVSKGLTPNHIRELDWKHKKRFESIIFRFIPDQFMAGTSTGSERLAGPGFDCPENLLIQKSSFENRRGEKVCGDSFLFTAGEYF